MAMAALVAALAAATVLSGCGSDQPEQITISGQMQYTGSQSLPDKARARVSMVEQGDEGAHKRIVAERTLHDIGKPPIKFDLSVAQNLLSENGHYALRGEILDESGDVRWASENVRVAKPQEADSITLQITPLASDDELSFENYRCDDGFHLSAATGDKSAVIRLGNRRLELTERDAQRYADTHDNALEVAPKTAEDKDEKALVVTVDGQTHQHCALVRNASPEPSGGDKTVSQASAAADSGAASSPPDASESTKANSSGATQ